jgi:integrase
MSALNTVVLALSAATSAAQGFVFHRDGRPVGNFRKSWARACKAADIPDRIFHDLRRTAARDFRQASVSEGEIMRLCGWKTRAMFDRYNIVNNEDSRRAVRMRVNGKGMANKPVEAEQAV